MKYIVKLTKYKHRMSVNIPAVLVRKQKLEKYDYMIMEKYGTDDIIMRGYKDDEKSE